MTYEYTYDDSTGEITGTSPGDFMEVGPLDLHVTYTNGAEWSVSFASDFKSHNWFG